MINPWRLKSPADNLCKQFGPRSGPRMSVLIWISTIFDCVPAGRLLNVNFEKSADDNKSMKNNPASKETLGLVLLSAPHFWADFVMGRNDPEPSTAANISSDKTAPCFCLVIFCHNL